MYLQKEEDNLSNYYLLPLLSLNKGSFEDKFINSFLNKDNTKIVVQLREEVKNTTSTEKHKNYLTEFNYEDYNYVIYNIPKYFIVEDLPGKFCSGKYSSFSLDAIQKIRMYSGLTYKQTKVENAKKKVSTHHLLLALEKDKTLKKVIEERMGQIIPEDMELVSLPLPNNFIDLE